MESIGFSGSFDLPAYRRAYYAVGRPDPVLRWVYTVLATPLVFGLLVFAFLDSRPEVALGAVFLGFLGAIVWLTPELAARAAVRRGRKAGDTLSGEATSERIRLTSRYGTLEFPWEALHGVKRSRSLVLLYQSPEVATVIPRSFFRSQDEFELFAQWAREGSPRPSLLWPVVRWVLIVSALWVLVFWAVLHQ